MSISNISMSAATELKQALELEREWRRILDGCDSGSYCESAGYDYKTIQPIVAAYEELTNALLVYERSGLKKGGK